MTRERLPNARSSVSYEIEHFDPLAAPAGRPGKTLKFHITGSRYPDGRAAEVFIHALGSAGRGSMLEALARDVATLISIALQHGTPVETMRRTVSRDEKDRPQTFVGAVLDSMEK